MVQTCKAMLPRVEKTLQRLSLPSQAMDSDGFQNTTVEIVWNPWKDGKYVFGDEISLVDLNCLCYKIFFNDAEFNKYADMSTVLAEAAPTVLKEGFLADNFWTEIFRHLKSSGSRSSEPGLIG